MGERIGAAGITVVLLVVTMVGAVSSAHADDGMPDPRQIDAEPHTVYHFADFAGRYRATLTVPADIGDEVFVPGVIRVFDRASGRKLIEVASSELTPDLENGKVKANVHELPYGEQSLIVADDFNFDGIKDLAVMDGQNSCYHGPSYQIYLGNKSGGLKADVEFTDLAQSYCGLFDVDADTKQIHTMTKDGCCWHEFDTFAVIDNKPVMVEQTVESYQGGGPLPEVTHWRIEHGKKVGEKFWAWDKDSVKVVFEFTLAGSGKRMVLFRDANDAGDASNELEGLNYALLDRQGDKAELVFPAEGDEDTFGLNSDGVQFSRGNTRYRVFGETADGGPRIEVDSPGHHYVMPAVPSSVKGTIPTGG